VRSPAPHRASQPTDPPARRLLLPFLLRSPKKRIVPILPLLRAVSRQFRCAGVSYHSLACSHPCSALAATPAADDHAVGLASVVHHHMPAPAGISVTPVPFAQPRSVEKCWGDGARFPLAGDMALPQTKCVSVPTGRSRNTLSLSIFWRRDFSRVVPTNQRGMGRKRGNPAIWAAPGPGESRRTWRERVGWKASKPFVCSGYTTRPTGLADGPCLRLRAFRNDTLTGGGVTGSETFTFAGHVVRP